MSSELLDKTIPTVQSKGARTRERLLDVAYDSIIRKGFSATSIEELVAEAGITKSGFFYHFRDKNDLARQILERFHVENEVFQQALIARARELSADPLHAYLVFIKLYAEAMSDMVENHPGCLVATITFQDQAFDREVTRLNAEGVLAWRKTFLTWLEEIAALYPPKIPTDLVGLADGVFGVTAQALILSKALRDPSVVSRDLLSYRDRIRLTFGA
ncbi:TetR/AcrR family transcriptional regulator [Phenylobacterium sp.]|uniref:TetR/AcrR family transcriptional regulator n=1 Tax=Phenylobacterium sp. TaxID=1871053 RepID=UPI00286A87A2|nr:TetR/AcrR family transcriptional regulator [Phenylobacterium sp.]